MSNNNHDANYDPEFEKDKAEQNASLDSENEIKPDYDEDRDIPDLNQREHTQGKKLIFYGILFVVFVVIFISAVVFAKNYQAYKQQKKAEEAELAEKKKTNVDFKTDRIEKDQAAIEAVNNSIAQEQYPAMDGAASEVVANNQNAQPDNQQQVDGYKSPQPQYNDVRVTGTAPNYSTASGGTDTGEKVETAASRKLSPEMLIGGSKGSGGSSGSTASLMAMDGQDQGGNAAFMPGGASGNGNGGRSSAFSKQYQSTAFEATSAMQRNNLSLLLKQGTMIPCVLKTKIVSTYAGQTACQVTKDVYSANGKTLLIERGSSVIGEQTVKVERGSARVFVLWSKLDTPKGVSFTLDSGTVDNLGASGMNAKVNNHFWQRFGGAIMLSIIEDGLQTIANKNNNSQSGGISYNSSSDAAKEMANTALENSINIPPTATVNQGTLINIFVARDVDFTGVYKLAHR